MTAETRLTVYQRRRTHRSLAQVSRAQGTVSRRRWRQIPTLQLIQERTGRVLNIRWAERLVVMQYPDEAGHHLEVVNFKPGLGALEIRSKQPGTTPDVALYPPGVRDKEAATRIEGPGYALFVVPSGKYDILLRAGGRSTWTTDVDVPLDRTRLWLAPDRVPVAICARSDGGRRARRGSPPE